MGKSSGQNTVLEIPPIMPSRDFLNSPWRVEAFNNGWGDATYYFPSQCYRITCLDEEIVCDKNMTYLLASHIVQLHNDSLKRHEAEMNNKR